MSTIQNFSSGFVLRTFMPIHSCFSFALRPSPVNLRYHVGSVLSPFLVYFAKCAEKNKKYSSINSCSLVI